MLPRRPIIELDRGFVELDVAGNTFSDADTITAFGSRDSWAKVLLHPCAVILGEAGTGKTTEFQYRCESLVRTGVKAFYVTVEDVAESGLGNALGAADQETLVGWRTSVDRAYFFLDAVDEARLSGHKFTTALRELEKSLRGGMARAHVLISCRVSDWRPDADLEEMTRRLFPDLKDTNPTPIKVYAIAPLNDAQVLALAASLRVPDPDRFASEARRATAAPYLERPRDVEWLAGYWMRHGDFGTLTDLIENDVREKLLERNPNRQPTLSPSKAQRAAQVLAGLATILRKASLRLPDTSLDPLRSATALDPALVLPDLSPPELAELLTLALFDEATYGRIRIHHRSVSEFLAAEWFRTLLDAGLAPSDVESLIFRPGPDGPVIPAELAPVAAWLAANYGWVRSRLLQVAPWTLLQGGDPNRLDDDTRCAALNALAERYRDRKRIYTHIGQPQFDHVMLGRLASAGIVDTLNSLLRTSTNEELVETLLTIAREGRLVGCVGDALDIAKNVGASSFLRSEAVATLASIASAIHIETFLADVVDDPREVEHEVAAATLGYLHPKWVSTDRVLALVVKAGEPRGRRSSRVGHYLGQKVFHDMASADRIRLMQATLERVRVPGEPKRARNHSLLDALAHMVREFAADAEDATLEIIVPALRFFSGLAEQGQVESHLGRDEIVNLISENERVRRLVFWDDVATTEEIQTRRVRGYSDLLGAQRLWRLTGADAVWLASDARTRPHVRERLIAFDCLLNAVPFAEGEREELDRLLSDLASADVAIRTRLRRHQEQRTAVPQSEARWLRMHRLREARDQRRLAEDADWLAENLESLRSAASEDALVVLAVQASLDSEDPEAALSRLAARYGSAVADATRDGWRRLWRAVHCKLPHEEEDRNTFEYSVVVGLAGLALDVAGGLGRNQGSCRVNRHAASRSVFTTA